MTHPHPWHIGERTIEAAGHTWTLRPVERGGALGFWIAESPHKEDRFLPTVQACADRLEEREADGTLAHGGEAPPPVKCSVTCACCRRRPATCGLPGGELVCAPCANGGPAGQPAHTPPPGDVRSRFVEDATRARDWLAGDRDPGQGDAPLRAAVQAFVDALADVEAFDAMVMGATPANEPPMRMDADEDTPALAYKEELEWLRGEVARLEEALDLERGAKAEWEQACQKQAEGIDELLRKVGRREEIIADLEGEVVRLKEQRGQETSRADHLAREVVDLNEVLVRWQAVGNDFGITGKGGVPDEAKVARFRQGVCNNATAAAEVDRLRSSAEDFRKASNEVDDLHERLVTAFDAIARLEDQVDQLQAENGHWHDVNTEHIRAENERLSRAVGRLLRHRQLERELRVCEDELGDLGVYIAAAANEPPANRSAT